MIAKKVPMRSLGKSDYGMLVEYLTDRQDKYERLGYVSVTNCQSEVWQAAIAEVLNTQAQNTRATADKTYHLIVSFRADDQPDEATLKAIETRICDGLGYGEHQRVCVVHHDTDNLHFHIAINKIHPTRYTIRDPYNDHWNLGKLCQKLEQEFRLEADNHLAGKTGSENRADDMERQAGVQSLLGWIKRECAEQLLNAQNWAELHAVLSRNGLELREKGNGLVITNGSGLGVKASSVARELSKTRLERRMGAFEPANEMATDVQAVQPSLAQSPPVGKVGGFPPSRSQNLLSQLEVVNIQHRLRYEARPMPSQVNTAELYLRYQSEQQEASTAHYVEKAKVVERKNRLIESAKKVAQIKRGAIKIIKGARTGKKVLYGIISRTLKDKIRKINRQCLAERLAIDSKYQRRTWVDWLRTKAAEGDHEALIAMRARDAACGLKGDTVTGRGGGKFWQGLAKQDCITKKGTVIYRVGSTAVRDDGNKLKVSRGFDLEGLQAALGFALERYGDCIAVSGSEIFKANIVRAAITARLPLTFADPALEIRRRELLARESTNEHHQRRIEQPGTFRSAADRSGPGSERLDSRGFGQPGLAATGIQTSWGRTTRGTLPGKPDIGGIGRKPPPQGRNRLREMSELGVVQLTNGGEMLLPRNVPDHLEQPGAKRDYGLRRDVFRSGRVAAGQAAEMYIAEREAMRLKVEDIPKHTRFDPDKGEVVAFAGVRRIGEQALALLKSGEEIMVLPVDDATARRLKRTPIGDRIAVTAKGSLKTRGRSR